MIQVDEARGQGGKDGGPLGGGRSETVAVRLIGILCMVSFFPLA